MKSFRTILTAIAGSPARAFTSGVGIVAAAIACSGYGLPMAYGIMALAICGITGFVFAAFLFILAGAFGAVEPAYRHDAPQTEGKDQP